MHQDVLLDACLTEYMRYHEFPPDIVKELWWQSIVILSKKYVQLAVEYADDGTDPLEFTEFGSYESELDYLGLDIEDCMRGTE